VSRYAPAMHDPADVIRPLYGDYRERGDLRD
jgi:hypothetical protein